MTRKAVVIWTIAQRMLYFKKSYDFNLAPPCKESFLHPCMKEYNQCSKSVLLKYKWYKGNEFSQSFKTREMSDWRLQGAAESRDWLLPNRRS